MPFKYNPFLENLDWYGGEHPSVYINPYLFPHSLDGSMEIIEVFTKAEDIYEKFSWACADGVDISLDTVWPNTVLVKFNGVLSGAVGKYFFATPMKRVYILALYYLNSDNSYEFRVGVIDQNNGKYYLRKLCPEGVLQSYSFISGVETVLQDVSFPNGVGYKLCSFCASRVPEIEQALSLKTKSEGPVYLNTSDSTLQYFTGCELYFHSRVEGNDLEARIVPPLIIEGIPT